MSNPQHELKKIFKLEVFMIKNLSKTKPMKTLGFVYDVPTKLKDFDFIHFPSDATGEWEAPHRPQDPDDFPESEESSAAPTAPAAAAAAASPAPAAAASPPAAAAAPSKAFSSFTVPSGQPAGTQHPLSSEFKGPWGNTSFTGILDPSFYRSDLSKASRAQRYAEALYAFKKSIVLPQRLSFTDLQIVRTLVPDTMTDAAAMALREEDIRAWYDSI